jgi:hypothetical protein
MIFLELMVWAIHCVESIETRSEWEAFLKELVETRKEVWSERPWSRATENAAYLAHVRDMASVFANADPSGGVSYPSRRISPLADSSA